MLLMIDNYDSFTYNIVQYFSELGAEVRTVRNNEITLSEIENLENLENLDGIAISPGPCTPNEAGISNDVLRYFAGKLPIFGVCLGMQCMAATFGGEVIESTRIMHGKTSLINHSNKGVFQGLPNPLKVMRYHSLVANADKIPKDFEVTAWIDEDGVRQVMGLKHLSLAIEGVQFHPESFLSQSGKELLNNFLITCQEFKKIHA